jgi:hypothetical protein
MDNVCNIDPKYCHRAKYKDVCPKRSKRICAQLHEWRFNALYPLPGTYPSETTENAQ